MHARNWKYKNTDPSVVFSKDANGGKPLSFALFFRCLTLYFSKFSTKMFVILIFAICRTCKGYKEPQDVIGSLENSEDPKITHDPLKTTFLHETHATKDLNGFICHYPRSLWSKHLQTQEPVIINSIIKCLTSQYMVFLTSRYDIPW